jgi:CRP-like cAMP-binding protein
MLEQVIYDEDEIEEFLKLHEQMELEDEESLTFKKLMGVQDKISIISNIDVSDLRVIITDLKFIKAKYKDMIIQEGDISEEIFFILSGECQVFVKNKKVGILQAGKTFGETAAIFHKKRNASVVCASENAMLLSFSIDHNNMEFCAPALATIYKNLASQINAKLEEMNSSVATKK